MMINKEGNKIGVTIEADDLLTQIAIQRVNDKKAALTPKSDPKTQATKKA